MSDEGAKFTGDWDKTFRGLASAPKLIDEALKKGLLQEAHRIRNEMLEAFDKGGDPKWKPHSPLTLVIRRFRGGVGGGGSKLLIRSGGLRNSIVVVKMNGGLGAFIGVKKRAAKSGADIARIHELGATWTMPLTSKMARFLFAAIRKAGLPPKPRAKGAKGASTLTIRIPARPFIGPVLDRLDPEAIKGRMEKVVVDALDRAFGR